MDGAASPYLSPGETEPGLVTVGEHFPHGDTKHPDVRGMGEGADSETFRGTPRERVAVVITHTVTDFKRLFLLSWQIVAFTAGENHN